MKEFTFTKMHGLGNDFIVIDGLSQSFELSPQQIQKLATRHFGIGFDQLLLLEKSSVPEADFNYRIFNADGSEVEQCGNGARCFARYVVEKGLSDKKQLIVNTKAGLLELNLLHDGQIKVALGEPEVASSNTMLSFGSLELNLQTVRLGNPHAILDVDDLAKTHVADLGQVISRHHHFPEGINAGFRQILSPNKMLLRVFERGVGETLACGSGACAAVASAIVRGDSQSPVSVRLPGGICLVEWEGPGTPIYLTGPAVSVFEGHVDLNHLGI